MADAPQPSLIPALGVVVAGLALAVTGVLPWAGMTAEIDLFHTSFTHAVHGTEDGAGWFVVASGLAASTLGIIGMAKGWLFTGLAILPGAVAAFSLAMFLTDPRGLADRLSFGVSGVLQVHPTILYGWFAALLASIVVAGFAAAALIRRRP
ncbi:hypothetical protein Aph01nite_63870 [Acrocarpospora phusangensis]|uniref:Uncharacterized protein n=1 Tax=Acrocarpospora phusangensis TaxID=1070424 RepID=A0A919QKY5_9ACTN|nr:hypothetical protein [Acrocarpospora phusangensis]GIH28077.1 hypothetical protein Aph01nite_63870 [Acrocarpospora phusangensis]